MSTIAFSADTAATGASFDGVADAVVFNPETGVFTITDGKTGAVSTVSSYTRAGETAAVAALNLDLDQDGHADPYAVMDVRGVSFLYAAIADGDAAMLAPVSAWDKALVRQRDDGQVPAGRVVVGEAPANLTDATVRFTGLPQARFGDMGIDLTMGDPAVRPGDDFYRHSNGTWLNTAKIPDNRPAAGMSELLSNQAKADLKTIVEGLQNKPDRTADEQKVVDFYTSYLDTDAIDTAGLSAVQPNLDAIQAAKTHSDIARLFGESGWRGGKAPLGMYVGADDKNPGQNALFVGTGSLGMGGKDIYLEEGAAADAKRAAYQTYITVALTEAGAPDAAGKAAQIMALETELAKLTWDDEEYDDAERAYNPMTLTELQTQFPAFDWNAFFSGAKLAGRDKLIAVEKDRFAQFANVIAKTPVDVWQAYLTFQTLSATPAVLPQAIRDASFEYAKVATGQKERSPRWQGALYYLKEGMPDVLGQSYADVRFPPEAKAQINDLVTTVTDAMGKRIPALDWLSAPARAEAETKRAAMGRKLGYPDKWKSYDGLDIRPGDAAGNAQRIQAYHYNDMIADLDKPVDKSKWGMAAYEVNAYYDPLANEAVFPAAYLQAPNFDPNADPAVNYGGIGATIGHELSHGYDPSGAQYDATGALRQWMSDADLKAFEKRSKALIKQFDGIKIAGAKTNGEQMGGEIVADLVGLTLAYDAYKASLNGVEPPVINGLTGDQRFFRAYAQSFCELYREEYQNELVLSDSHPPEELRVNTILANFTPWYDAYNVQPGDKNYRKPKDRITIW